MRDDRQRLVDILDAIDRVYRHTGSGREAFERDELVQVWVLRHLQLIGEAARRLSQEWRICFRWRDGDALDVEIIDYH